MLQGTYVWPWPPTPDIIGCSLAVSWKVNPDGFIWTLLVPTHGHISGSSALRVPDAWLLVQALPSHLCLCESPLWIFKVLPLSLFGADSPLSCSDFLLHWVTWVQCLVCRCTCMFSRSMLTKTLIVEFRSNLDQTRLHLNVLYNVFHYMYKIFLAISQSGSWLNMNLKVDFILLSSLLFFLESSQNQTRR